MAKKPASGTSPDLLPSSEEQAFLQLIRDNHPAPKHYQEFANWLESQDDNRSEAVRQGIIRRELMWELPDEVRLWQQPDLMMINDAHTVYRRQHRQQWRDALPKFKGLKFGLFDGGLVDQVKVPKNLSVFKEHVADLFATTAVVELMPPYSSKVELFKELFEIPEVAAMKTLVIGDNHHSKVARGIAESPQLSGLKTLMLRNNRLKDADAKLLAEASHLSNVSMLSLADNRDISSVGIEAIVNSPIFKNLSTLFLNCNDFESDGGEFLAKAKYLKHLRWLDLFGCDVNDAGLKAMVESGKLNKLEIFDVRSNDVTAESLEPFLLNCGSKLKSFSCSCSEECDIKVFHQAKLPKLEQMVLWKLTDASLSSLARSGSLKKIKRLEIQFPMNTPPEAGFSASTAKEFASADFSKLELLKFDLLEEPFIVGLAKNPTLKKLKTLCFSSDSISDKAFEKLFDAPWVSHVEFLSCKSPTAGDSLATSLAKSGRLKNLRYLSLKSFSDQALSNQGLAAIAASKGLEKLESLEIYSPKIDDDGIVALCESPMAASIRKLSFSSRSITGKGLLAIESSMPNLGYLDIEDGKYSSVAMKKFVESKNLDNLHCCEFDDISDANQRKLAKKMGASLWM